MAKRKKQTETKQETPKKKATPSNPKPKEPSAISVNPSYDSMPDTIEDPAAVFKMAMLDMKRAAIHNKLAVVAQEHEKRVKAAVDAQKRDIEQVKMELREAEQQHKAQKDHIEQTYGIALRCYTYNDETGVLTKHDLPEEKPEDDVPSALSEGAPDNKTLH